MKFTKYLMSEGIDQDLENFIRDNLSGTPRKTTADMMFNLARDFFGSKVTKPKFMKVWNDLVKEKYLVKVSGQSYKWEM